MSLYALGPEKLTGRDRELGYMREGGTEEPGSSGRGMPDCRRSSLISAFMTIALPRIAGTITWP